MDLLLWTGLILPGQVIERDVCVTALGPNGLMDRDIENNTSCTPLVMTVNVSVGISETLAAARVHPTPFTDHFVVDLDATGNSHLRLHDAAGAIVLEQQLNGSGRHVIPANGLPSGMYVLTLHADQVITRHKLLRE